MKSSLLDALSSTLAAGRWASLVCDDDAQYVGHISVLDALPLLSRLVAQSHDSANLDTLLRSVTVTQLLHVVGYNAHRTRLLDASAPIDDALSRLVTACSSLAVACPNGAKARARVQRPVALVSRTKKGGDSSQYFFVLFRSMRRS